MAFNGQRAVLPVGGGGLTGTHSMSQVPLDMLLQAQNLTYENGTLQKEGGANKYNSVPLTGAPTTLGGFDWWPTSSIQRMIVLESDGTAYRDDGTGVFGTTLATGITVSVPGANPVVPVFVEGGSEAAAGNKKLFMFTGANTVKVIRGDGAVMSSITSPPADWAGSFPITGVLHENRLWGALGHRLYYSDPTDHENFTSVSAGTIVVYPGEGDKIIALMSFKGQLLVFKYPKGVYVLNTTDPTLANWKTFPISKTVGAAGPLSVANMEDDVLWVDPGGIFHLLSAVREYGDFGFQAASAPARMDSFLRENANLARLPNTQCVVYEAKREVHFAVSKAGSTVNNARLVIDFNNPQAGRWRWSDRDVNESLWLRKDTQNVLRIMSGDNAGIIWAFDQTGRIKDTVGYMGKFQSPHYDLSHIDPQLSAVRKNGHFLECVVEPKGNWNLLVDILWDGKYTQTIAFNMGVNGAGLGSFTLDSDVLATDQIINRIKRITGGGRRISLVGYNNGIGQDFSISQFILHYTIGDERNTG